MDNETYTRDVIIFPDRVRAEWWRREGHELCIEDLGEVWPARPEVLVVGTGYYGRMVVLPEVEEEASRRGVRLLAAETKEACGLYNQLRERSRVVAALHLTC